MEKMDHEGIGSRLRAIRTITRLRDREIALALGVGRTAVTESMRGRRGLGREKIAALEGLLGLPEGHLVEGKGRSPARARILAAAELLMWESEGESGRG